MEMRFSIIVPVYNAEKYLKECIESLLRAASSLDGVEIICVNDGSSDRSRAILGIYKDKIKVINQNNGGVSCARNRGLEEASGEYICFVDSDDTVRDDWLVYYWNAIKVHNHPDAICIPFIDNSPIANGDDLFKWKWQSLVRYGYPWRYVVKREIANKIRFPLGVAFGEDSIFDICMLPYLKRVASLSECKYEYRVRNDSAMSAKLKSQERLNFLIQARYSLLGLNEPVDIEIVSRMILHSVIAWLCRPADVVHHKDIREVLLWFYKKGWCRESEVGAIYRIPFAIYRITAARWPIYVINRLVKMLVAIRQKWR